MSQKHALIILVVLLLICFTLAFIAGMMVHASVPANQCDKWCQAPQWITIP